LLAALISSAAAETPTSFGAVCDVKDFSGGASWSAGGTLFIPNHGITPTAADVNKKLLIYGAGTGGASYVGTITGVSGSAWSVSPSIPQAPNLRFVDGAVVMTSQSGVGSYVPGDTITPAGGATTGGSATLLTVKWTKVASATVAAGGSGGYNGSQTVTGTTGKGIPFKASVTVSGGAIAAVNSSSFSGYYSQNPTTLTSEPVTGANLTGARLNLKMGVAQVLVTNQGGYSSSPSNPVSQGSTSGSGTGATFNLTMDLTSVLRH